MVDGDGNNYYPDNRVNLMAEGLLRSVDILRGKTCVLSREDGEVLVV